MNITIEIARKGNGKAIGPKDTAPHTSDGRTQVKPGDVVTFTIPGAANSPPPTVAFVGTTSPVSGAVTYNTPLRVVGPPRKVFKYNCTAVIDGESLGSDSSSGGEMEIIEG
jgi:hypothetical protein